MATAHKEVPIQVVAWVDEGVAALVEALNILPGIETLDSCQDDQGTARVYFRFHESCGGTVQCTDRIARALAAEKSLECSYDLSIEYRNGYNPIARIATAPECVSLLASAVRVCVPVAFSA